jgi:hypothetical protein
MNRDDIIRAAQESGLIWGVTDAGIIASLERFAAMVAAHEREECANVCDSIGRHPPMDDWSSGYRDGGRDCASLIRAMCEK